MAAFVNSAAALVDWNSRSIDCYNVRHLLSAHPPRRSRRHPPNDPLDSDLDRERYLDLPSQGSSISWRFSSFTSLCSTSCIKKLRLFHY
ncbi:hypothetical protein K2173_015604 [Erythroxylum novogranatense]|uniref:Suppressor of white apricot N-terminal domain-containing protein n=1 Tax=Erythroxylum novogranatense TaxID=1862640 RepID=A0AAV8SEK4_9ROSI|nr:hypothetical protein K2173_015604 [Erythroxylum novogranatense]